MPVQVVVVGDAGEAQAEGQVEQGRAQCPARDPVCAGQGQQPGRGEQAGGGQHQVQVERRVGLGAEGVEEEVHAVHVPLAPRGREVVEEELVGDLVRDHIQSTEGEEQEVGGPSQGAPHRNGQCPEQQSADQDLGLDEGEAGDEGQDGGSALARRYIQEEALKLHEEDHGCVQQGQGQSSAHRPTYHDPFAPRWRGATGGGRRS
jgi:hypothetical protein